MKKIILLAIISIISLGASISLFAQSGNTLSGKVTDVNTGESLPGATIQIEKPAKGVVTDANGQFSIKNINRNKITFTVRYIGYEEQKINMDFGTSSHRKYHIKMKPSAETIEGVEVEGESDGQVKAMLQQKRAENIKNVISSEQIEAFPDMNAAEAVQRIPGITLQRDQGEGRYIQLRGTPPEFTNFNVNGEQIPSPEGDVRYVGMDIISADQIEMVEVTKVLTPDMDADGIGGNVNIITKRAEDSIPDINASMSGGYSNLRETENYQLQFSYGQRIGKFGFNMNSSYYKNNQGADNIEFKYEKGTFFGDTSKNNYHMQYREVQLRHYEVVRKRIGLSATFDYRFSDKSYIYLRGMYNNFSDQETRRRKVYTLDDALSEKYYLYGGVEHDVKDREKIQQISTLNLGGEHDLDFMFIDYEIAWSVAEESQPDRVEAIFENPGQAIAIKFDMNDPDYPKATFPNTDNPENAFDYEGYELDKLLFEKYSTIDNNISSKINLKVPYKIGKHNGYVKFGGKMRLKNKFRDIQAQSFGKYDPTSSIYPIQGDPLNLITISDGFKDNDLLNQGYVLSHMPDPGKIRDFYEKFPTLFIYGSNGITETRERTFGEDYEATEDIYAGYFMFRQDINKLMILGGLRYEKTDIDYQGYTIEKKASGYYIGMDTITDKRTHDFLLPYLQFKYQIFKDFNIRAALTHSYVRPNFEDVIPYREVDQREEVRYGNPNLKYPYSTNIDVLAEKYFGGTSLISGGFFYKSIDNFIFNYKLFGHEGDPAQGNYEKIELEVPLNGNKAFVYGSEIQAQFKLEFLPWPWNDFGIYTNYTYTYSEAYINKRYPANDHSHVISFGGEYLEYFKADEEEKIQMPGQAMHTTNLALFYDAERFYIKLSANYHDDFLYKLGVDPDLDEYYAESWHMDFTANYSFNKNWKVFVDVKNLTNAPLKFYMGSPDYIKQQEFYSWWGRIGVKLDF